MVQADACRLLHQHAHEVWQSARARGAVACIAWIALGFGHHLGHIFHVAGGAGHHAKLEAGDLRDGGEVFYRVVVELFINMGKQHHGAAGQHDHSLAIGFGDLDCIQGNASTCAGFVVHDDGAKVFTQGVGHHAGQNVCGAAGRKTHHDLERRFVLRLQAERECSQRKREQAQTPAAKVAGAVAGGALDRMHECLRLCGAETSPVKSASQRRM